MEAPIALLVALAALIAVGHIPVGAEFPEPRPATQDAGEQPVLAVSALVQPVKFPSVVPRSVIPARLLCAFFIHSCIGSFHVQPQHHLRQPQSRPLLFMNRKQTAKSNAMTWPHRCRMPRSVRASSSRRNECVLFVHNLLDECQRRTPGACIDPWRP